MKQRQIGRATTLIFGLLAMGLLYPTAAWSQEPSSLQQVEKQLHEKRIAAEAHQQQMQGIKDPAQLSVETQRHFRMTEEILALMLERRKLMAAQAMTGSTPARGAPGGPMRRHGRDPRQSSDVPQSQMPGQQMSGPERGAPGGHMQRHAPSHMQLGDIEAMEQMLQRITEHSAYMDTLQDREVLTQEMRQHQKMLDQMLKRMQQ
jgi:hypothetical protein